MNWSFFNKCLLQVTIACLIWALGVAGIMSDKQTLYVYLMSIVTYVIFSVAIFFFSRMLVDSGQMYTFNGVVSLSFIIKLLMAVASIWVYEYYQEPTSNAHVFHYILIYLAYTAFEVYYLTELGKER